MQNAAASRASCCSGRAFAQGLCCPPGIRVPPTLARFRVRQARSGMRKCRAKRGDLCTVPRYSPLVLLAPRSLVRTAPMCFLDSGFAPAQAFLYGDGTAPTHPPRPEPVLGRNRGVQHTHRRHRAMRHLGVRCDASGGNLGSI